MATKICKTIKEKVVEYSKSLVQRCMEIYNIPVFNDDNIPLNS